MLDCDTCSELSKSLDEALVSVNAILESLQKALADRDQERVTALDLELESVTIRKDIALNAWLHHRKSHSS